MQIQKPKQGYKLIKSLFGNYEEIPEEWEQHKLKNLADKIGDGIHSTPNYVDNSNFYFINGNNLLNGSIVFSDHTKNVDKNEYQKYKLELNEHTILLSINGTIGNVSYYDNEKIILGKSVCYIICNQKLDRKFLFYLLKSNYVNKYFKRELTGTTISNLSLASIKNSPILLPKIKEQQKIALILSNVDSLIQQTQKIIEQTQNLKKGLTQRLLTKGIGHTKFKETKLGKIPEEWEIISLENCVKKNAPITYGIVQAGPHIENGIPYIRTGDMKNDRLSKNGMLCTSKEIVSKYKRSEVKTGELVFAIRATVGKVVEVPPELDGANLTQGTARISPNTEFNNRYLLHALRSACVQKQIREVIKGTTFAEITLHNLRAIKIVKPSLVEQNKIAGILDHTYFLLETLEKKEFSLETLKKGLMQKLLTGQIRVKA